MLSPIAFKTSQEDFLARVTEAAYTVVLRNGLQRSFVDIELELWQEIRRVFPSEPAAGNGNDDWDSRET